MHGGVRDSPEHILEMIGAWPQLELLHLRDIHTDHARLVALLLSQVRFVLAAYGVVTVRLSDAHLTRSRSAGGGVSISSPCLQDAGPCLLAFPMESSVCWMAFCCVALAL